MSDKNKNQTINNEDTEVVISGIRKSRSMLSKVADITNMFMKKKDTAPMTDRSTQEFPTRISHPLDRSSQMGKLELSNKGHNFQKTDVKLESEKLHEMPSSPPPAVSRLPKVNSNPPIGRSGGAESYTNVNFNIKNAEDEFQGTQMKEGLLAKFWKSKKNSNKLSEATQINRIQASENTQVFGRDETVIMAAPKLKNSRRNLRLAMAATSIAITLFIARDIWSRYKKNSNESIIKTPELIEVDANRDSVTELKPSKNINSAGETKDDINYTIVGRGLVYSCRTKQWSCLDAPNYRRCRANMKAQKKSCITRAVLETVEMCQKEIKVQAKSPAPPGC